MSDPGAYSGPYGNHSDYLVARIARDRPDILEDMKAGRYRSFRRAAIDAGIIRDVHPEDLKLNGLLTAWARAPLEDRQLFLALADDEIEAAYEGRLVNGPSGRQCLVCGQDAGKGWYCSNAHRQKAYRERQRERRAAS